MNLGLQSRCDGLESTYNGEVVDIQLPAGSLTDTMSAGTAIGEALSANQAAGVLVPNAQLIDAALSAVQDLESDAQVGVVGRSADAFLLVLSGQLLVSISDGGLPQASHVMLALKNVDSSPSIRAVLALTASQAPETTTMLIRPAVLNLAYIENLPEDWRAQICALTEQFDPERSLSLCDQ